MDPSPRAAIRAVRVVVPAHDEQDRVAACLVSVQAAARRLRRARPGVAVSVLLVLDRCTDDTAVVAAACGVPTLEADAGSVGGARRAGVAEVVRTTPPDLVDTTLVVNTDADCVVPTDWLLELVDLAAEHDLVQGEVEPDPADMTDASLATWWERHPRGRGSLHGANLAVRLGAYVRAGGFPAVTDQEDLLLVRALKAAGAAAVGGTRVVTSGRRDGRVPGGFAGYLRLLDAELLHPAGDGIASACPSTTISTSPSA